jgi:hypothetical protein
VTTKSKIFYALGGGILLISLGYTTYARLCSLNSFRLARAAYYINVSESQQSPKNEVIYLIQANLLDPTPDKYLKIGQIYQILGDYNRAQGYIHCQNSQAGFVLSAETALQFGDYERAEVAIDKITDQETKEELTTFLNISTARDTNLLAPLPLVPKTNLGNILRAINTRTYTEIEGETYIGAKIKEVVSKYPGKVKQQLEIGNILNIIGHPRLSIMVIDTLLADTDLPDGHAIKAKSYYLLADYQAALKEQLVSVNMKPSDIHIYEVALQYAILAKDRAESIWLTDNIKYLQSVKEKSIK